MNTFKIKVNLMRQQTKNAFYQMYLLNNDISLYIPVKKITFETDIKNIHLEGRVPQFLCLGVSFDFIQNKTGHF